jgi:hypothetical protein
MDEQWIVEPEKAGWAEDVIRVHRGHIEAAYRRALRWGYRPPLVAVRFRGDVDTGGRFECVIKAVDPADMAPIAAKYGEDPAPFMAAIESVPAGMFPVMLVDDGGLRALRAVRVPDRN